MTRGLVIGLAVVMGVGACAEHSPMSQRLLIDDGIESVLPAGIVRGRVFGLDGDRVVARPGATVRVVGTERRVTADVEGHFTFLGLPAGPCQITAEWPGYRAEAVSCRLPGAFGVDRVPVILAPSVPMDGAFMVGTLTDPRGAGLPAGTIHLIDARGGNRRLTADAAGCFVARLPGGNATLTGYGVTPGGLHVEARSLRAIAPTEGAATPVALVADLVEQPGEIRRAEGEPGTLSWVAKRLPTRRDELAVRLSCAEGDRILSYIEPGRVSVLLPPGCEAPSVGVRLLPLGLD